MFTEEQIEQLAAPLDRASVKTRQQAGANLSYIEGWHAIAEANRIFGYGNWDRETQLTKLGEPEEVNGKWRVRYMGQVRITVRNGAGQVVREGIGYGSGIAKDLGDAHEGAIKEAETDAMKRALMTFGNPFGLALYDKTQANVADEPPKPASKSQLDQVNKLIKETDTDIDRFCQAYDVTGVAKLTADAAADAIKKLNAKKKKAA